MAQERARQVKVGIFVTVLLVMMALSVFLVEGSSDLLEDRYTLNGSWADVAGLKEGAVVRLAGWDVGEVSAIRFSDDLGVKQIFVELKIMQRYQPRIRADSEARIETVGVLGDKYVSISMGDPSEPVLDDREWIHTREALDVVEYTKKVTDILTSTTSIAHKLDLMMGEDTEAASGSLAGSMQHLEGLLSEAEQGNGLLHALVYDDGMTRKVDRTLSNLEQMSNDLRSVTGEIRGGDGLVSQVIYGKEGGELAGQLGEVATAMTALVSDLKRDDSLMHSLLYDPEKAQMMDDLAATAAALRVTSEALSQGDGTIGLLARDPTLYEDLRSLVGGAQRNKLLRAYIRQTVKKSEQVDASPWQPDGQGAQGDQGTPAPDPE